MPGECESDFRAVRGIRGQDGRITAVKGSRQCPFEVNRPCPPSTGAEGRRCRVVLLLIADDLQADGIAVAPVPGCP